jgi:hypothetical protein
LQKTGGYARNWQLAACACKICFRVALSFIVSAHFPNQISKGRHLNSQKHGRGCRLANAKKISTRPFTHLLSACLLSCNRVAARRMQIVSSVNSQIFLWCLHFSIQKFFLAACLQKTSGFARNRPLSHAKFASCIYIVPKWLPVACKLYPSGLQLHANCTQVAASRMQIVPAWLILFMLHGTGGHVGTICMQLAGSRVQFICDWLPVAC